eukprot:171064-Pyramimonas_sp.AAC.1
MSAVHDVLQYVFVMCNKWNISHLSGDTLLDGEIGGLPFQMAAGGADAVARKFDALFTSRSLFCEAVAPLGAPDRLALVELAILTTLNASTQFNWRIRYPSKLFPYRMFLLVKSER